MFKKPKIKIVPGEATEHTRARYRNFAIFNRQRKIDYLVFILLLIVCSFSYYKSLKESQIPNLETLPQYLINVERIRCDSHSYSIEGFPYTFYELVIQSFGYKFVAVNMPPKLCKRIAKTIQPESDILISHYQGLIFEIVKGETILLRNADLLPGIEEEFYYKALPHKAVTFFFVLLMMVVWLFSLARENH